MKRSLLEPSALIPTERSLCPILPSTRPSGDVMPSMANKLPLGLSGSQIEGTPFSSTYCVNTCPFLKSFSAVAASTTKRPSPWLIAVMWVLGSRTDLSSAQGLIADTILVRTMRLMWRPMVLYVRVGISPVMSRNSPYIARPVLTSAWNPLQIPRTRPSRFLRRSMT